MRHFAIVLCGVFAAACDDPVYDRQVEALGGEDPAVPQGPLHRPGQPCNLCHGDDGEANPRFSFAGTVYRTPGTLEPLHGATVRFIDSSGAQYSVVSNCAGNFYVGADNFRPVWPVWMKLEYRQWSVDMVSPTSREGSCAACHRDPASPSSVGHVYLADEGSGFTQEPCE